MQNVVPEGRDPVVKGIWSRNLILLAVAMFLVSFGTGLVNGASTNFFVNTLKLSGAQVLWLAGIREIPGLILMFIAALFMHLPLKQRAAVSVLLMGVGYGLYALVQSYTTLIAMALIASLGFHNWMPLGNSLTLGLCTKETAGRVMGVLSSVGALASIAGVGMIAVFSKILDLRSFFMAGGLMMAFAAGLLALLPKRTGETKKAQPRLLFRPRYWLYYVLTLFEGSRTQVFGTFGTLILVQNYGLDARDISLLLVASSVVNLLMAPVMGHLLDKVGERRTLPASYVLLALCFVGYATVHNPWFLAGMVIGINLLVMFSIGLTTYVNRISPREELTPTLSTGVSVNHITSVSMSLIAGTLLRVVGYENLCWGAAAIIMCSVPFALMLKVNPVAALQAQTASAE